MCELSSSILVLVGKAVLDVGEVSHVGGGVCVCVGGVIDGNSLSLLAM